jgi:hypothetical protein
MTETDRNYYIAYPCETALSGWDIVEQFAAENDAAANDYANVHYGDTEWYVLDEQRRNINSGVIYR